MGDAERKDSWDAVRDTERRSVQDTTRVAERRDARDAVGDAERKDAWDAVQDAERRDARDAAGSSGAEQPLEKPPYSYVALIAMAIQSSPEQRLPLRDIYAYIAGRFPYYRGSRKGWQNSVRHNLSLNPCFRRLPRRSSGSSSSSPCRGGEWALDPAFQDMFPGGDYSRRRRRRAPPTAPRALPPVPPAPCPALALPLPRGRCCCWPELPGWGPPAFLSPPAWPLPPDEMGLRATGPWGGEDATRCLQIAAPCWAELEPARGFCSSTE